MFSRHRVYVPLTLLENTHIRRSISALSPSVSKTLHTNVCVSADQAQSTAREMGTDVVTTAGTVSAQSSTAGVRTVTVNLCFI